METKRTHRAGWKLCPDCQTSFKVRYHHQAYCSRECRDRYGLRKRHHAKQGNPKAGPPAIYLDGEQVAECIELYDTGEWTLKALAQKYSRSINRIWQIVNEISGEYRGANYQRTCPECGTVWLAHSSAAQFCGELCRARAGARRRYAAAKAVRDAVALTVDLRAEPPTQPVLEALRRARWRREDYQQYGKWEWPL